METHLEDGLPVQAPSPSGFGHSAGILDARPPLDYALGGSANSYGTMVWVSRIENLKSHLNIILDYLPEDGEYLRGQVQQAVAEASRYIIDYAPARVEQPRHTYTPHRKYPWFCGVCGYPSHETLKHLPAKAIEARSDKTGTGLAEGESAAPQGFAQTQSGAD